MNNKKQTLRMMNNDQDVKAIERIEETLKQIEDKQFNIFFFVIDSRNTPNSSMAYVYEMAKVLHDKGYNVTMLYQLENEYTETELYKKKRKQQFIDPDRIFVGVGEWLGKEYMDIPHMNIAREQWKVGPADILFIPEAFSSLMYQTYQYKAPCKRIVLLTNYTHVTDFIPAGVEWKNYGIYDAVASTKKQSDLIQSVFPYVKTKILPPSISPIFRKSIKPKKLIVNVITNNQRDFNNIVKTFQWKYPVYKFIPFVDLRNCTREEYAEKLKDAAITIWVDDDTQFGHAPLEAMRCGNLVIGKVPQMMPEWLSDGEKICNGGIWTFDFNQITDMLSNAIGSWMQDSIPSEITDGIAEMDQKYTYEQWIENVDSTMSEIIKEHAQNFKTVKASIENNMKKGDEQ